MELITIQLTEPPVKTIVTTFPCYSLQFAYFNGVPTDKVRGFFKTYFHTFISAN